MEMPFVPIEVFCSYAESDAPLLEQLEHHLSALQRQGQIITWHKRRIIGGHDWQRELDQHLNTASLILLLISPDFLASNYLYGVELQQALLRWSKNEAHVIPILLRPCDWKGLPFEKLQVLPRNEKPLTLWSNRDAGLTEITKEIRKALEAIQPLTTHTLTTACPRIWQVPYQRNPVFTGREDLLRSLADQLQVKHPQTQAISGLGGIGKTQLAVEYAYRAAAEYQAVFWIVGETKEVLDSGYTDLAQVLNLPEKENPDQYAKIQAVRRWLETHTRWLLILDNVEDLTLLPTLLPPIHEGQVLVTTRTQVIGRFAHRLEVPLLSNEDGGLLLLRRAGLLAEQGSVANILEELFRHACKISAKLGDLPLALDQAGAYIDETRCSLTDYQRLFQKRGADLLQRRGLMADDYPESVATTWSLSFERVEQRNPAAADLLRLTAFLAAAPIPEELLIEGAKELGDTLAPVAADEYQLNEAIAALRAYSLIARDPLTRTLTVHHLVQAVLHNSMSLEIYRQWRVHAFSAIAVALSNVNSANRLQLCRNLYPHVIHFVHHCMRVGAGPVAELLLQQVLELSEQELEPMHPQVAVDLHNLVLLYGHMRKYVEAEPLLKRALAIREQVLGTMHPDTAYSLNNLAILNHILGKDSEAKSLLKRAVVISERVLGRGHPNTQIQRKNYFLLLRTMRRKARATNPQSSDVPTEAPLRLLP
ncbi:MAG: tetratricopeptide repeat protein [Ktedonobacteraceae bacterium]|nr:tetratricopeptide repeat protein [Ktedonobacteraceae bacterium]